MKHLALSILFFPVAALAASPPTISGIPPSSTIAGEPYSFTATITDTDTERSKISCVVKNKPSWITLSYQACKISGVPQSKDVGLYSNIQMFVKDGSYTVAGKKFSIAVIKPAQGSVTLSWTPPTKNTDGSSLANLAGYRIFYGVNATALDQTIMVSNAGLTTYIVDNLSPATYYFAVRAYNTAGGESVNSNIATKTIR